MITRPPSYTRSYTLFPYTVLPASHPRPAAALLAGQAEGCQPCRAGRRMAEGGMSDKLFRFLDLPRQPPKAVPVAIRVLGYGEISGDFAPAGAVGQAER